MAMPATMTSPGAPSIPQMGGGGGGLNPIDSNDILTKNLEALFGQFKQDWDGDNEMGNIMRRLAQALFPVLASRLGIQNQMIPAVEQAYQTTTAALSPEGAQQAYDEQSGRLQRQGEQQGNVNAAHVRAAGGSPLAAEGARLASQNQATEAGNDYLNQLFSPNAMLGRAQQLGGLQEGASAGLTNQGLNMGNFIEGRSNANKQDQAQGGFGGILGSLGGIMGMIPGLNLASMFGGMGGMGGGGLIPGAGNGSSSGWQPPVTG